MAPRHDDALIYALIERVRDGLSIREACEAAEINRQTFYNRINANPTMRERLDSALRNSADMYAERADSIIGDMLKGDVTHQKARVAVEHWQWRAERADPARYGAKGQVEHRGAGTSFIDALKQAHQQQQAALESKPEVSLIPASPAQKRKHDPADLYVPSNERQQ